MSLSYMPGKLGLDNIPEIYKKYKMRVDFLRGKNEVKHNIELLDAKSFYTKRFKD